MAVLVTRVRVAGNELDGVPSVPLVLLRLVTGCQSGRPLIWRRPGITGGTTDAARAATGNDAIVANSVRRCRRIGTAFGHSVGATSVRRITAP